MPAITNPIGVEVGLAYVITGPDGTRAVLNDITDPDFVGFTDGDDGVTGLERAGVRENGEAIPEADGGVHGAFRYDRLAFTLKGIIPPDSPAGANDGWVGRQARLLAATDAMGTDAYLTWTPSFAVPVRLAFRQQQPTRITGRRPKSFLVAGVAEASTIEAAAPTLISIDPATAAGGGFASPLTSLLTSTATTPAGAIITNRGRRAAWPVITVFGPCTGITLRNATLGLSLFLNYTVSAGDYLTLYSAPRDRRVRLNDTANRYSAVDWSTSTGWWPLAAGANDIRIGMASYSAGAHVEVSYRDAWG